SRQIALIDLPCTKNARRIFAIVSTISIPTSASRIMEATVDPQPRGPDWMPITPKTGSLFHAETHLKLVGTAVGPSQQGHSVSLSGDGNTAIVGGPSDNANIGAAWVYTRSNGVWTQQGSKLVGSGAVGNAAQGYSVALSADGNTAAIGGPNDSSNA